MNKSHSYIAFLVVTVFAIFTIFGLQATFQSMKHHEGMSDGMHHEMQPCTLGTSGICMSVLQHINHFQELMTSLPLSFFAFAILIIGFLSFVRFLKNFLKEQREFFKYKKYLPPRLQFETIERNTSPLLRSFVKLHPRLYA